MQITVLNGAHLPAKNFGKSELQIWKMRWFISYDVKWLHYFIIGVNLIVFKCTWFMTKSTHCTFLFRYANIATYSSTIMRGTSTSKKLRALLLERQKWARSRRLLDYRRKASGNDVVVSIFHQLTRVGRNSHNLDHNGECFVILSELNVIFFARLNIDWVDG